MIARMLSCALLMLGWSASTLLAVEFPDSKLLEVAKGKVTFESQGKQHSLLIGMGIKFHHIDGKELAFDDGVGMLLPGNVVQIVAAEDATAKEPQIIFMRLLSGKIPGYEIKPVDLLPEANFKGEITTGSLPQPWIDYFPTAKVGDFAEYKGFGRVRYEVLAVKGDSITVARVVDTRGTRHEFREQLSLTKAQKDWLAHVTERAAEEAKPKPKPKPTVTKSKSKKKLTPAQERAQKAKEEREAAQAKAKQPTTETLKIDGKEILCDVEKESATSILWTSPLVPFDHIVKRYRQHDNIELVKFGRGK